MSFFTALKLSEKNIRTKKFRTALTSFASSIGIIGIALILALSNGFDKKIAEFESGTLSGFPILISRKTEEIDMDHIMGKEEVGEEQYPDAKAIFPYDPNEDKRIHTNSFTEEYLEYIGKMNPEWLNGITYTRMVNMNILRSDGKTAISVNAASINFSTFPTNPDKNRPGYLETGYDLLAGRYPSDPCDLVLVTDKYNKVDQSILESIGLSADVKNIPFGDILGRELRAIPNNEYYKPSGDYFVVNGDPKNRIDLYNSKKAVVLRITGIVRPAQKTDLPVLLPGVAYSDELSRQFIEDARQSAIVKAQRKADYNVLTGEAFHSSDNSTPAGSTINLGKPFGTTIGTSDPSAPSMKDSMLSTLGADGIPYMITIYPVDFRYKDEVLKYLDAWNQGLPTEEKVVYTDLAGTITGLSGGIMHAITIVLIAFAATSLVVSLIMIGIITYVSVLERTKEIGVLRALGARKKDITRVFNAETFLIGVVSGLLGILLAALLTMPVNRLLHRLTDLKDVAVMNPFHAAALVLISVVLTMLGGLLPARMAAKKDPVAALRSE